MELRHLRYFLTVAEELNMTRAAARLGIGQPPLSQQIKDLEKEMGVKLFHRIPQGVELTEAGTAFLEKIRPIPGLVSQAVQAAQRAGRGESGMLHLGFNGTAAINPIFPKAIRAFRERYPEVALRLDEANSVRLIASLMDGSVDVALLRPNPSDPEELQTYPLVDERLIAALPDDWLRDPERWGLGFAEDGSVHLPSLKTAPMVLTPRNLGIALHDEILKVCRDAGFSPVLGQPAPQIASILSIVSAGMGYSLLPETMQQLSVKGVSFRHIHGEPLLVHLSIMYLRSNLSPIVHNFVQHLRNQASG
ncbi:LysR family transcriptional regulator [Pokkaliibacter sp. CJK22405]|uniref:LysR family transcriptional regulator n=1 Tax=Pokkaliibacter sp. CJK22405 TaxID=3384615 RepID=UPI00398506F8